MDPDKLFEEIVELAEEALAASDEPEKMSEMLTELSNKLDDMGKWHDSGGFTRPEWRPVIEDKLEQIQLRVMDSVRDDFSGLPA